MSRTFDHHLHVMLPCPLGKLPKYFQFKELCAVVGIVSTARTHTVAKRYRHVIFVKDFANLVEMLVKEALCIVALRSLTHDGAATAYTSRKTLLD